MDQEERSQGRSQGRTSLVKGQQAVQLKHRMYGARKVFHLVDKGETWKNREQESILP